MAFPYIILLNLSQISQYQPWKNTHASQKKCKCHKKYKKRGEWHLKKKKTKRRNNLLRIKCEGDSEGYCGQIRIKLCMQHQFYGYSLPSALFRWMWGQWTIGSYPLMVKSSQRLVLNCWNIIISPIRCLNRFLSYCHRRLTLHSFYVVRTT